MSDWISVKVKPPKKEDSPILAIGSLNYFSTKALHYTEGWDGEGWYDSSDEYGMGLNCDEAFFDEFGNMLWWMALPQPPKDEKNKHAKE